MKAPEQRLCYVVYGDGGPAVERFIRNNSVPNFETGRFGLTQLGMKLAGVEA